MRCCATGNFHEATNSEKFDKSIGTNAKRDKQSKETRDRNFLYNTYRKQLDGGIITFKKYHEYIMDLYNFFLYNVFFFPFIIYNQINFYIVSRTACLEMNQFFTCFAILDFCLKLIVHTSSYKKIYQFCTVSRTD